MTSLNTTVAPAMATLPGGDSYREAVDRLERTNLRVESARTRLLYGEWDPVAVRARMTAAAWAEQQVAAVRDDPSGRLALMQRCYYGPFGKAPRHLPYRRAATAAMRWELRRGVLQPPFSDRPGSPWWRAVNERVLRDGCEAVALSGDLSGSASSRTVEFWLSFAQYPTARAWWRAHNGSIIAGYLEHRGLAETETAAERFFMNVVLCRVLYTHALVAAPRIALGWLRPLAPLLGDPRLGMAGIFLQLSRVLPDEYPLREEVRFYLRNELGFGRLLDYGVIVPRLQQIYEWSAHDLADPGLLDCVDDGALTYAMSADDPTPLAAPRVPHPPPGPPSTAPTTPQLTEGETRGAGDGRYADVGGDEVHVMPLTGDPVAFGKGLGEHAVGRLETVR